MSQKVEIITDESGNKKSVVMPYALYERLITELATHNESLDKVMEAVTAIVQAQECRVESKASANVVDTKPSTDLLDEFDAAPPKPKDPKQDILRYQRARGYFTETGGFWVLEGSVARFMVSNAFEAIESLVTLRRKLIDEGVLGSDPNFPDYVFMRDCYFSSASAAACIVDGNARNNPSVWKKK